MKIKREIKDYTQSITTASMPDLAFILLIFLILSSKSYFEEIVKVKLPRMKETENINKESIEKLIIYIDKEGKISLQTYYGINITNISPDDLCNYVNGIKEVIIYGDSNIDYAKIHNLLLILEKNNIKKAGFICEKYK